MSATQETEATGKGMWTWTEWRDGLPVLRAPGVTLREPRLADAESFLTMLASPEVSRFISRPPADARRFEQFIAWTQRERQSGRCVSFGVVPDGHADAVGLIQARQLEPDFGTAEWGFALGHPFWGNGLFMKAAPMVVDFLFRHVGAHRLEARAAVQNGRGNGVLHKLGATPEGVLRKALMGREQHIDQVMWSMLAEDWLASHDQPPYQLQGPVTYSPEVPDEGGGQRRPTAISGWRAGLPLMKGERVTLRELEVSDAPSLFELLSNKEVGRFIPPPPASVAGFERFILWTRRQREAGRYACFGVVPAGGRPAVGIFQLRQLEPSFKTAEWGFALGVPFWGKGIFAEAARLFLDFVFETVGVHRLEARAPVANVRGNGALRKIGAVREGCLRRSFILGGEYYDDALWSILEEDWRKPGSSVNVLDGATS